MNSTVWMKSLSSHQCEVKSNPISVQCAGQAVSACASRDLGLWYSLRCVQTVNPALAGPVALSLY